MTELYDRDGDLVTRAGCLAQAFSLIDSAIREGESLESLDRAVLAVAWMMLGDRVEDYKVERGL